MFPFKTAEMGAPRGQVIGPGWFTEIASFIHVTVVVPIILSVKAALSLHQNGSLNIHPLSYIPCCKMRGFAWMTDGVGTRSYGLPHGISISSRHGIFWLQIRHPENPNAKWCKSAKPFPQAPGAFFLSGPAASSKESQNTPQPPLSSTNSSPGRRSQGRRSWLDDGGLSFVALLLLVTLLGPRTWM